MSASRPLRGWQVWAISFAIAAPLLAAFLTRNPQLYDNDSYYHLAVARAYFEEGLIDDLRWARFSAMADGFGDKEVLFHLLLAPFAGLAHDPVRGGQIALALLLAALFATLSVAARRTLGSWAMLLPWWLAFASTELAWRWVRLRPELLSLLLLVCALEAIGRRRYRALGAIAALYALSYTAFHAFLGLCALIFLFSGWARRRWEWALPLPMRRLGPPPASFSIPTSRRTSRSGRCRPSSTSAIAACSTSAARSRRTTPTSR